MKNKGNDIYKNIKIILAVLTVILSVINFINIKSYTNIKLSSDFVQTKTDNTLGEIQAEWGKSIGGTSNDQINCIVETSDGGYIVGGYFNSSSIDLGNGVVLNNSNGGKDGMIIKYSKNGEVEWGKTVGGSGEGEDKITCIVETQDGGYAVGGHFGGRKGGNIELGDGVVIEEKGAFDGIIIKYSADGKVEWGKSISGSNHDRINCMIETKDGGYIIGGSSGSVDIIDLGNGVVLDRDEKIGGTGGILIKYDSEWNAKWIKSIESAYTTITCVTETIDGDYIAGGYFSGSNINFGNGVTQDNIGDEDGIIIKYRSDGKVEWGKIIGGTSNDQINCIVETSDGGCVVGGYFNSSSIDLGSGVVLNNNTSYNQQDGMIIKYGSNGKIEWGKVVGGNRTDYIACITKTLDGGYAVGGYSESNIIELENGVILNNSIYYNGIILKYDNNWKAEWGKVVGGSDYDYITCITAIQEGKYVIGGYFKSSSIDLENGVVLNNTGNEDGMIIKYGDGIDRKEPIITINPENTDYTQNTKIQISVEDTGGSELSEDNSYQYYISTSSTEFVGGEWKDYTTGQKITIGEGENVEYYIFVKRVEDNAGNVSIANGEIQEIEGETYHRFGPYKFDNINPKITKAELVNSKIIIEANDMDETLGEGSGVSKYRYITSTTQQESPEITEENSIEVEATGKIEISNIDQIKYIYVVAEDKATNRSNIVEIEVPEITTESQINIENGKGQVTINWELGWEGEKTYKVYQKREEETGWTEVGTTNEKQITINELKDEKAPTVPTLKQNGINEENKIQINQTAIDNGSIYKFYIEAYDLENNTKLLTSEEIEKEITTGIKGYYYTIEEVTRSISENEESTRDINENEEKTSEMYTESNILELDISNNGKIIRMKAVDVAGNIGEENSIEISIPSKVTIKLDGGTLDGSTEIQEKEGLVGQTIEIGTPTKEGYTFTGWEITETEEGKTEEELVNKYGKIEGTQYTYGTEESEVTAKWQKNKYKYKVKYIDKETDEEIKEEKEGVEQEYETEITTSTERIEIEGYNYDSVNTEILPITANEEENIIEIYYTKRKDLKYIVKYINKETTEEIKTEKLVENQTYKEEITTNNEIIEIAGYKYDSISTGKLEIKVNEEENIIEIYYIPRRDLRYTVNYIEEDTNNQLHQPKVVENQEFGKVIEASKEAIEIEGYEYSSSDKESITIGIDETQNIINLYYIKRSDLKYTVKYLEKGTDKEIHETKTAKNQVYGGIITARTEIIEIEGYNYDSTDKESIKIGINESENVITVYYTKRTDIKYKIEYYLDGEKDENRTEEYEATYNEIIEKYEEKEIQGYTKIKTKGMPLTIVTEESKNVIKIYYAKNVQVKVQYINKNTDEVIEEITEEGYIGKELRTEARNYANYILVEEPEEKTVEMQENMIIKYYYIYVSEGVIEKHIDIDTNEILYNTTYEGNEGEEYTTTAKEFRGYDLVETPENAKGTMTKELITVNYYYKKKTTIKITIKYIDKNTNEELEEETVITGYEGETYEAEQKNIEGYEFVEVVGEVNGVMTEDKEVIYYYKMTNEPEVPGEGGAGDSDTENESGTSTVIGAGDEEDPTIANKNIPNAGWEEEVIALSSVVIMSGIALVLTGIAIKRTEIYRKYKE